MSDNTIDTATVMAEPPSSAPIGTVDEMADYLTEGFWGRTYAYNTATDNVLTVSLGALTEVGQQLARWALDAWEMVADLDFVEVASGANISFDDNQSGAFAGPSGLSGDGYMTKSTVNVSEAWIDAYGDDIDSYSMQTYIHEIGHALGLGHMGDYDGSANYGTDETFANDSWQMSIMSYFSQNENTLTDAAFAWVVAPMMVDIAAIQDFYGSSTMARGDTVWGQGADFGNYLDNVYDDLAGGDGGGNIRGSFDVAMTIFDESGSDTIDLSFLSNDTRLDLRSETFSDVDGGIGNLGIASNTVIENAKLGSGDDTVTANSAANDIQTGAGNDTIITVAAGDVIDSGAGSDLVEFDLDLSAVTGGKILGDTAIIETEQGAISVTNVEKFSFNDQDLTNAKLTEYIEGLAVEGLTITGSTGDDTMITGSDGDDDIGARGGSDIVEAAAGNDRVGGGMGADTLYGGDGLDEIRGARGSDVIYGGAGDDDLYGNRSNDLLYGGTGEDGLNGGRGDDVIFGSLGEDSLFGGAGDDRLNGNRGADVVAGGDGADDLSGGKGHDDLSGDAGDDKLYGSNGRDRLDGGSGDDLLSGGSDADVFIFGAGDGSARILDFEDNLDTLEVSKALLNGGEISDYASIVDGNLTLRFELGETLIFSNELTIEQLEDDVIYSL